MSNHFKRLYVYGAIVDNWMSEGVVLMFIFLAKLDEKDRRNKFELIYQSYRLCTGRAYEFINSALLELDPNYRKHFGYL